MKKLETNIKRKLISLPQDKLIELDNLASQEMPLVIKPSISDIDIADWAKGNQEFIEKNLLKYGAILFRGFDIVTATEFERFSLAICSELFHENGEHPRQTVSSNVYTPVFYPAEHKLLWHNENSFNHRYPMKILFGCRQPAQQGGETPIVDSRKVFQRIDSRIRERFIEKKVMYVRNYSAGLGLDWQTVFQTQSRAELETICQNNFLDLEWKKDGSCRTRFGSSSNCQTSSNR